MEKLITSNSSERVQANNNAPTPKIKKRVKRRKPEEIPALEPKRVNKIETCSRLITIVSILTITLSILTFIWYLMEMYVYEIKHYLVIVNAWSDYSQTSVFIGAILILMLVILCAAFGLSLEQTWNLNYLHTVSFLSAGATVCRCILTLNATCTQLTNVSKVSLHFCSNTSYPGLDLDL